MRTFQFLQDRVGNAFPKANKEAQADIIRQVWAQIHGLALLFVTNGHTYDDSLKAEQRERSAAELFRRFVDRL